MSTALRKKMHQDLQLAGLSEGTQDVYLRALRRLAVHFDTPPDVLNEAQVRDYLLHLKNDRKLASSSLGIAYCGLRGVRPSFKLLGASRSLEHRATLLSSPCGFDPVDTLYPAAPAAGSRSANCAASTIRECSRSASTHPVSCCSRMANRSAARLR